MLRLISRVISAVAIVLASATVMAEPPSARTVMTWVPPYAVDNCRARLDETVDGIGPKTVLTHLALQFWQPTREGGLEIVPEYKDITDARIIEFRDWARAHGIHTMLCVYNGCGGKWDWALAEAAFADHREAFANALVAEMKRLDLDGIDVDLEGDGAFDRSQQAFTSFVSDLSGKLHGLGKRLTVDSFPYKWNAPNQTWWPKLFPLVDGINSMGYDNTGAHGATWQAYSALKAAANAAKLSIGVAGFKSDWLGNNAAEHVDWIARDETVGIAIWDAQFSAPAWRSPEVWKALANIHDGH
jgi:hypothetical protein